jgi:hypothetical protein
MANETLSPPTQGYVRLRLQAPTGRWLTVGPFGSLGGARRMAEDLITEGAVRSALVQHKSRGCWAPAWSFRGGRT